MRINILFIFLMFNSVVLAQGYAIDLELNAAPNKEIQLTYHYLDKIYATDTTRLNSQGQGTLKGDTLLPQGLYKIYLDNQNHFDFLIGADQHFLLKNKSFQSKTMEIEGAVECEEFVAYLAFLEDMKKQSAELNTQFKNALDQDKEAIKQEMQGLNTKMQDYWESIGEKYPGSMLYKFLVANYVPTLDVTTLPEEVQQNDSLLLLARFAFQKEHFWDHFDYTDERMLYTPFYKPKLETWFNKVLYPDYDSVKPYVYAFLDEIDDEKRIFQFATSHFLNASINSNVLGMDALFIDIATDYYFSGKAFWATEESMETIRENVLFMQDNLIGKTAPDLTMESFDGEYLNLHQMESELTLLLIYEPNCSHCKVFVPELYKEVFLPNKDKSLEVFAVYSMDDKEEWTEFLTKHNMFEWNNVWDPEHTTRFKIKYDARKTPGIYVLDKNKTILAKKLDITQLKQFVARHF